MQVARWPLLQVGSPAWDPCLTSLPMPTACECTSPCLSPSLLPVERQSLNPIANTHGMQQAEPIWL